jgi:hypothetical protein
MNWLDPKDVRGWLAKGQRQVDIIDGMCEIVRAQAAINDSYMDSFEALDELENIIAIARLLVEVEGK